MDFQAFRLSTSCHNLPGIDLDIEENVEDAENLEELEDENHPYLYEGDLFHPNDAGYQIMADALYDQIQRDLSENLNLFLTQ